MASLGKSIVFAIIFLAFSCGAAQAANFYVDPAGSDSNSCTDISLPCQTIQGAISKSSNDDVVYLAAGEYSENLVVDKDILLRGPNAGIPLGVNPGSRAPEASVRGEAEISAAGVTLDGLEFLRPNIVATTSVKLLRATTTGALRVVNSRFDLGSFADPSVAACGTAITGNASFLVEDSSFEDQVYAPCTVDQEVSRTIYLSGAGSLDIQGSEFTNSRQSLYLDGLGGDQVVGNKFSGSSTGGAFLGSDNILIKGNTFAGYGGVQVDGSSGSDIENNLFTSENLVAVYLLNGSDLSIKSNSFLGGLLTPDPSVGATVLNYTQSPLDALGNYWGVDQYSLINTKTYSLYEGGSVAKDVWIEEYTDDPAKSGEPGFWPLVKQFAWQVDAIRGLNREIGPFYTGQSFSLALASASGTDKNIIEAYSQGNSISDPYPVSPGVLYPGDSPAYYTILGSLGQAPNANVCLEIAQESFPLFIVPAFYAYTSSWQSKAATYIDGNLCATTSDLTTFMAASPGLAPENSGEPPRLLRTVQIRKTIETSPGTWRAYPLLGPSPYSYQWQRGAAFTGPWQDIAGETGSTYLPGDRDVGRYLRIRVRASNAVGLSEAFSPPRYVQASGSKTLDLKLRKKTAQLLGNGKTLFARLLCLEGYCQIKRAKAYLLWRGKKRIEVITRKTELIPGESRNIYLKLPASLYAKIPGDKKLKATLSLGATSTNKAVLSKNLFGYLIK